MPSRPHMQSRETIEDNLDWRMAADPTGIWATQLWNKIKRPMVNNPGGGMPQKLNLQGDYWPRLLMEALAPTSGVPMRDRFQGRPSENIIDMRQMPLIPDDQARMQNLMYLKALAGGR